MGKKKESPYQHDTLLLRTEQHDAIKHLPLEQKGMLLDKIFEYAKTEKEYISEDEEALPDNAFLSAMFSMVKNSLNYNWQVYRESCEQREFDGKLNAIIGALKKGQRIADESIAFLESNGFLTPEFLASRGVTDAVIKKLFKYIQSKGADTTKETDNLPFS